MFPLRIGFANPSSEQEKIKIPVLLSSLVNGQVIEREHLTQKEVDAREINAQTVLNLNEIIGKVVQAQFIKSHEGIKKQDLKQDVLVKKGETVRVVFQGPCLTITNQGIAQKDGALREQIPVEILNLKKKIYGTVMKNGEIKIGPSLINQ